MNVTQNSLLHHNSLADTADRSVPPAPRRLAPTPLRQRRELPSKEEAAGQPIAAAISIAATQPSWPRIFPGL